MILANIATTYRA